jgi:5-oxoprolinase (ATP-hydrolysing)
MSDQKFRFSIDRGGTFTDIFCEIASGEWKTKYVTEKLLSEDPSNYKDAPTEGIRRILEKETGRPHPRSSPVPTARIEYIRMGTTVATNALLERKGERIALLTTKGFKDLQVIGNQSRPKIFDLEIRRPDLLYETVCEVNERVTLGEEGKGRIVTGISREKLCVEVPLDEADVRAQLQSVLAMGIKSVAIVFTHSYTFTEHERRSKAIAEELGFSQISISSEVMPMVRMVPRGCTTCVDAYLTLVIKQYLANFRSGFDAGLEQVQVSFMQSDGGLTPMHSFSGNRAILSGPAGGVVGYARTSYHHDDGPPAITEVFLFFCHRPCRKRSSSP